MYNNPLRSTDYRFGYLFKQKTWYGEHKGIDLVMPKIGKPIEGVKIYADEDGRAEHYEEVAGGLGIRIFRNSGRSVFLHLSERIVPHGTQVKKGDLIALSGNTGTMTTAPHLHWHIINNNKLIDPQPYLKYFIPLQNDMSVLSDLCKKQSSLNQNYIATETFIDPTTGKEIAPRKDWFVDDKNMTRLLIKNDLNWEIRADFKNVVVNTQILLPYKEI